MLPEKKQVLIVDDEPNLRKILAAQLSRDGYDVLLAEDGEQGLTLLREHHIDLVVTDLKMPKVDGMAFFREVSAKTPHVAKRLVFVTGDVAGTDAERFLEESGCRWVPKPFRLKDLVRLARETLR